MKKLISLILLIVIVAAAVYFIPKLVHTCDSCDELFVGTGYEPNIISEIFSDGDKIICRECAEKQHAVSIALGKDVEDFKVEIFETDEK